MILGTGIQISFESGFLAEIIEVRGPSASRVAIDMSHHGTVGGKPFAPGELIEWGEVSIDIGFDPTATPPIDQPSAAIIITWPDSAATTWSFNGFMTAYEPTGPLEDRMTASVTIRVDGDVTI